MKRILFSMLLACTLTGLCIIATAVAGQTPASISAPNAQVDPPQLEGPLLQLDVRQQVPMSVSIQVEIETTGTQTISVPLLIDLQTLITLAGQETISAVLVALAAPEASELQTVTVSMPTTFTPIITVQVLTPSIATTQTLVITTTLPLTDSTQITASAEVTVTSAVTVLLPSAAVNANVRAAASTESEIVGQLIGGDPITLTGQNADGSWYQLENGNWVVAFVVANAPSDLPVIGDNIVAVRESIPATITVQALILRSGPSTSSDRIGTYAQGSLVAVTGRAAGDEWVNVVTPDGNSGWMFVDFLELSVPLESIPVLITTQENVITGRVQDQGGEGVNDILIAALQQSDSGSLRVDATSTTTGTFFIYVPPAAGGEWRLEIVGLGCSSRIVDDGCQLDGYYIVTPTLTISLPLSGVAALNVAEANGFLAGSVVLADGAAAAEGLRINGSRAEDGARTFGSTTTDGKFVLPAAPGTWSISVEDEPIQTVEMPADGLAEPIELRLP